MTKKNVTDIVAVIVAELTPLASEERRRVIHASLTLLGEAPIGKIDKVQAEQQDQMEVTNGDLPALARTWMRQNGLVIEQLHQVFHVGPDRVAVIVSEIPGKTNRDKVRNAYILLGIAHLVSSGEPKFDDKAARTLCEKSGFYDRTNHMKYMKGGNEFTGSKDKGWTVTAPGLKQGAKLIKELSTQA